MKNISNKTPKSNIPAVEDTKTADLLQNLSSRSNALEILHRIVAAAEFELSLVHSLVMVIEEVARIDRFGERADYAETLQAYLFSHTAEHNEAFLDYKRNLAAGMLKMSGFDDEESEQVAPSELAVTLSGILNHPKLPVEIRDSLITTFADVFNNSADKSDLRKFETSPEYISLILDNLKDAPVSGQASVLDLSGCRPDQLNTRISEMTAPDDLGCVLSGLLYNPHLPYEIYNGIAEGIAEVSSKSNAQTNDTPEYIAQVIKEAEERGE